MNNSKGNFEEPDSVSDRQSNTQSDTPDSSDSVTSQQEPLSESSVSSSPSNSCSPHSSTTQPKANSTSNETPSVLTSQNCSLIRKSFLNLKTNSTSDNVVSTTPKFQLKSSSLGFLRPSTLSSPSSSSGSSFSLKMSALQNPFAKKVDLDSLGDNADSNKVSNNQSSEEVSSSEQVSEEAANLQTTSTVYTSNEVNSSTISPPCGSQVSSQSKFVSPPISTTCNSTNNMGFVFGQNVRDRVVAVDGDGEGASSSNDDNAAGSTFSSDSKNTNSFATTNGTSDMLFTSVLQKEAPDSKMDSGGEENGTSKQKSLSEAAREYEESRAIKRKYDEVAVLTGEEEEINVIQINCKLFLYDKIKTWIELGRGQLRLNDINNSISRIVIRASGSLRVVLNTKIWAEMVVQKASDNSIRLTAQEKDQVKVYLVKTSPKETDQLFKALEYRVNNQKKIVSENGVSDGNGGSEVESKKKIVEGDIIVSNGTTNNVEESGNTDTTATVDTASATSAASIAATQEHSS